jgi:6-phosphogluconolactonase
MRGEDDPRRAADEYEALLAREVRGRPPRLDFVFLGLGADGHTASLFPGTRALAERERACVANRVPRLAEWRLTLTYPVFNAARRIVFVVAGAEKRAAVRAILTRPGNRDLPAARVRAERGSVLWLLDEEAAGDL